jgi:hypothetical protein
MQVLLQTSLPKVLIINSDYTIALNMETNILIF